jgi:hypothetical protein
MKSRLVQVAAALVVVLVLVGVIHALAQPGPGGMPPGGGPPGGGFGGMMMMPGWPPAPQAVVVVQDGVVYVACDGVLNAFEAKTLKPLGQAVYWERPEAPQ